MRQVVLIGDSIRGGYQDHVVKELEGWATVKFPDENGGPSTKVLANLDAWAVELMPDIIHINAGLHDLARLSDDPSKTRTTEDEYRANVTEILTRLKNETNALIIWAMTTPVIDEQHKAVKNFERHNADVIKRNEIAREICALLDVPINDLYGFVMANDHHKMLSEDGVHFTEEARTLQGAEVARIIREYAE